MYNKNNKKLKTLLCAIDQVNQVNRENRENCENLKIASSGGACPSVNLKTASSGDAKSCTPVFDIKNQSRYSYDYLKFDTLTNACTFVMRVKEKVD